MPAPNARKDPGSHVTGDFDLAIIGGGALGCALAWEGATRGLRVVLLEQDDFGSGASANSLKVVHGGLRYLQKLDIARARASAAERSSFLRIAPRLVRPLPCWMPTRRSLSRGRAAMAIGLALNGMITLDRNRGLPQEQRLPAGGLVRLESLRAAAPGLTLDGATGGACWFDAQMLHPERLVLAFALGAEQHGAVILNHHRACGLLTVKGRVAGVTAEDTLAGNTVEFRAAVAVDCRNGWAVGDAGVPAPPSSPAFLKAVNLVLPEAGLRGAVGFPMRDHAGRVIPGRMLFATPSGTVTLVGTWYTRDAAGPNAEIAETELGAMLAEANASFGGWEFGRADLLGVQIGYLPEDASSIGRPGEPVPAERPLCERGTTAGLWHLQTEKWTTVRRLAQHFVDRLADEGAAKPGPSVSAKLRLPDEPAADLEISVPRAVRREHASTLGDVLRRCGIGIQGRPPRALLETISAQVGILLGWTPGEQERQIAAVLNWPLFQAALPRASGEIRKT